MDYFPEKSSTAGLPAKPVKSEYISLFDILFVFLKRWRLIFFSSFIAGVLIFGYALYTRSAPVDAPFNYLPNEYQPYVKIRLQDAASNPAASILSSNSALSGLAGLAGVDVSQSSNVAFARELLTGKTIMDQIIEELNFKERYGFTEFVTTSSRQKFIDSLEINHDSQSGVLKINYLDTDRQFATNVLNRTVELLEERFRELTMEKINNKKRFLEDRIEEIETELDQAEDNLIDFQIEHGIVDINTRTSPEAKALNSTTELVFSSFMPREQRHRIQLKYEELVRDKGILDNLYGIMMSEYERTKIEEMDDSKMFQVLERAEIPEIKIGPSRPKIMVVVVAVTFALAVLLAFFLEYIERLKRDPVENVKLQEMKRAMR